MQIKKSKGSIGIIFFILCPFLIAGQNIDIYQDSDSMSLMLDIITYEENIFTIKEKVIDIENDTSNYYLQKWSQDGNLLQEILLESTTQSIEDLAFGLSFIGSLNDGFLVQTFTEKNDFGFTIDDAVTTKYNGNLEVIWSHTAPSSFFSFKEYLGFYEENNILYLFGYLYPVSEDPSIGLITFLDSNSGDYLGNNLGTFAEGTNVILDTVAIDGDLKSIWFTEENGLYYTNMDTGGTISEAILLEGETFATLDSKIFNERLYVAGINEDFETRPVVECYDLNTNVDKLWTTTLGFEEGEFIDRLLSGIDLIDGKLVHIYNEGNVETPFINILSKENGELEAIFNLSDISGIDDFTILGYEFTNSGIFISGYTGSSSSGEEMAFWGFVELDQLVSTDHVSAQSNYNLARVLNNPVSSGEGIYLNFNNLDEKFISIYGSDARLIKNQSIPKDQENYQIYIDQPGTYFITISDGHKFQTEKILIFN